MRRPQVSQGRGTTSTGVNSTLEDPADGHDSAPMSSERIVRVSRSGTDGYTDWRLRHLPAPFRGTRYTLSAAMTPADRLDAALKSAKADGVLTDIAAAEVWRLPLPRRAQRRERVSVAVHPKQAHVRVGGVRGRRLLLPSSHLTRCGGLTVTTPARTWLDCAAELPIEFVVAMGDQILHQGRASLADLTAMIRWGRGRRGVVTARAALRLLDARSESPGESLVRYHLVASGLPKPQVNLNVSGPTGWLARGDLVWPEARVIVEYDGQVHLSEERRRSDAARRNLLQDAGWLVIVFTARDLRMPWQMCSLVRAALQSRAPH